MYADGEGNENEADEGARKHCVACGKGYGKG